MRPSVLGILLLAIAGLLVNRAGAIPPPGERPRDPVTRKPSFPVKRSDRSRYGKLDPRKLDHRLKKVRRYRSMRRRVLRHSFGMLGSHYRDDPLGEGHGAPVDADPRLQLAPVDCLTFVETVLALSLSPDMATAAHWMDRIRYHGDQIRYGNRNHFMMAQWLPHQQSLGLLRDITAAVAGESLITVHQDYESFRWDWVPPSKLPRSFQQEMAPTGRHELPVLPWRELAGRVRSIPNGSLLMLVREAKTYNPVRISHVGIVVQPADPAGPTAFRHASREGWGRVVDQKLISYVERLATRSRWPAIGVNIQLPQRLVTRPRNLARSPH